MKTFRVAIVGVGLLTVAMSSMADLPSQHQPASRAADVIGRHDFDFLNGHWRVHHRRLKPGTNEWVEFDGTCNDRLLMDGSADVEEHTLNLPGGGYRAVALRAYDSKTRGWAIWWLDGRYPHRPLDPPVKGHFKNGVGTFYSEYVENGKPMRGRFIWSRLTRNAARWEQAASSDAGKTWTTNWIMEFRRMRSAPETLTPSTTTAAPPYDFDFLVGDWRVGHRYLRAATAAWKEVSGTCINRPIMAGWANLEEHSINAPSGAYRALALRSYDPTSRSWAIWWLDGRVPHGDLDPPVVGRFQSGVGTFVGPTTLNGRPASVRFTWSQITSTSAHWEQAYSFDDGKSWETVWTMEFHRAA